MRKTMRGKLKAQKQILIISAFSVLLFFSVGYAAFSTTVRLNAKGNVHPTTSYTVEQLKGTVGTCGNGEFIADSYEDGRYVYRGADPCNYLSLNGETWRIISIEPDNTLKIIKEESTGEIPFDLSRNTSLPGITENGSTDGTRYSDIIEDLCYSSGGIFYGCKVWGSKYTMRNSEGILLKDVSGDGTAKIKNDLNNESTFNLPEDEAYLNVYLNGGSFTGVALAGWYNTWSNSLPSTIKKYILDEHLYNVGLVKNSSAQLIEEDIAQEKALTWKGRVGLLTTSEYVRASSNSSCTGVSAYYNNSECYASGETHNYLRKAGTQWTLSPTSRAARYYVWAPFSTNFEISFVDYPREVHPVLYLSSNVQLKGDGTSSSKFQIK